MKTGRNFDEGLGTVYERFMLNAFFDSLIEKYSPGNVLEVPLVGMTGLMGINSFHFASKGCRLTMADTGGDRLREAEELWSILPCDKAMRQLVGLDADTALPFDDASFDLVWNFAALWHLEDAERMLREMARVTSNLVVVFMPNRSQIGYFLRKHLFDRSFFRKVDERWVDMDRISAVLRSSGMKDRGRGILDMPPWPDTCVPIKSVLRKLGIGKDGEKDDKTGRWEWDIVSYYVGRNPELRERVERWSFLENSHMPDWLKALWAHHRYVIFSKN